MAFFRSNEGMDGARFLAEASLVAQASSAFNGVLVWLPLAMILFGMHPGTLVAAGIALAAYSLIGLVGLLVFSVAWPRGGDIGTQHEDRSEPAIYVPAQ